MEDAHAVVLDLEAANDHKNCFFAVYDGHGGAPLSFYPVAENILYQSSRFERG